MLPTCIRIFVFASTFLDQHSLLLYLNLLSLHLLALNLDAFSLAKLKLDVMVNENRGKMR